MIYDSSNGETQPQYLGLTSKAADSDKLDGKDSSEFASSSHNHTASNVAFTPSGKIAATNVQSAIEEVDTAATNANNAVVDMQADIDELDSKKQNKTLYFTDKTVATTDFVADTTYAGYGFKADITCTNVTSTMLAAVIFSPTEADSGNYAAVCMAGAGKVTIYAKAVPTSTITVPTIKAETV